MNDNEGINICKEFIKERLAETDNSNGIVVIDYDYHIFADFVGACIEMKSEILSQQVLFIFIGTLTKDQAIEE